MSATHLLACGTLWLLEEPKNPQAECRLHNQKQQVEEKLNPKEKAATAAGSNRQQH
jgi:hypothetical protein